MGRHFLHLAKISPDEIASALDFRSVFETILGRDIPDAKDNGWSRRLLHCPFHSDRNPSFGVNVETGRYKCFSACGGGDIFDFYRKMTGASFSEAKLALARMAGLEVGAPLSPKQRIEMAARVQRQECQREALSRFHQWQVEYSSLCGEVALGVRRRFLEGFKSMEEAEAESYLFHALSLAEYHLEILCSGDDLAKAELYWEVTKNGKRGARFGDGS